MGDIQPLETSDDDLGRRCGGILGSMMGCGPQRASTSQVVRGGGTKTTSTSTPLVKGVRTTLTSATSSRPELTSPTLDRRYPASRTPDRRHPASPLIGTPTLNRSFPRPTQSVSPEFPPSSPRPSSPEENSTGVDESKSGHWSSATFIAEKSFRTSNH